MRHVERPNPLGPSAACHTPTDEHEMLNQHCHKVVYGRRCSGAFKSDLPYIWNECGSSEETGQVGTQVCSECDGLGCRQYA